MRRGGGILTMAGRRTAVCDRSSVTRPRRSAARPTLAGVRFERVRRRVGHTAATGRSLIETLFHALLRNMRVCD